MQDHTELTHAFADRSVFVVNLLLSNLGALVTKTSHWTYKHRESHRSIQISGKRHRKKKQATE